MVLIVQAEALGEAMALRPQMGGGHASVRAHVLA